MEEAIESYKKAISIEPDCAKAYYKMGIALQEQGKLEESVTAFDKALTTSDEKVEASRMLDLSKRIGEKKDVFEQIKEILGSSLSITSNSFRNSVASLKKHINTFYNRRHFEVQKSASIGWHYDLIFHQNFLNTNGVHNELHTDFKSYKKDSFPNANSQHTTLSLGNIVTKLNEIESLKDKFHTLESANTSDNTTLFADSFFESSNSDLRDIQKSVFKKIN